MGFERQLAAIMFTDIRGYTRLMQISEDKAIKMRTRHREIFERVTAQFSGQIIQYYGDGTLSIFKSAVDAVRCGHALQTMFQQEPVIPVRIGIHMGDVVVTESDVIGDSVNVAARVESLGVPGSVLISGKVAGEIQNQDDLTTVSLGMFHFKNDAQPRHVYAMKLAGLVVPRRQDLEGKLEKNVRRKLLRKDAISAAIILLLILAAWQWFWPANKSVGIQQLGVLPFSNLMNDSLQDYLVDGIHEALISKLQLAGVSVKPKTSMLPYRNIEKSVQEITQELQVDGLIEGTVMRSGDKISIELLLISGRDEKYIWGQAFEGDLSNIMFIYGDITRAIASEIQLALTPKAEASLARATPVDSRAYDLYLKGKASLNIGTMKEVQNALDYFDKAIKIDPQLGPAYTGLVEGHLLQGFGAVSSQEAFANFRIYAQKAIELDERMAQDHHQRAMIKLFSDWDWKGAEEELLQAIEDDPGWSTYDSYSQLMWAMGKLDKSVWAAEQAVQADTTAHFAHCDLAWAYYYSGSISDAENQLKRTENKFGSDCPYHSSLRLRLDLLQAVQLGEGVESLIEALEAETMKSRIWHQTKLGWIYAYSGQKEKAHEVMEQMRNDTNTYYLDPARLAPIYVGISDYDTAFELLEEAYGQRSFYLLFTIKSDPWFDPIRQDPRYEKLLEKMGLADHQLD